jgi:hypothetical protein
MHPAGERRAVPILSGKSKKDEKTFHDHSSREAVFESLRSYVDSLGGLRKFKDLRPRGPFMFTGLVEALGRIAEVQA